MYSEIKEDINYQGEYAAAFGFHPAILTYNGISTVDGYLSNYSLEYKHKFREVIEPVLDNSSHYKAYYDNWGGRVYLFSSEVGFTQTYNIKDNVVDIEFCTEKLKGLNCKYVFSLYKLKNVEQERLILLNSYKNESSPYTIYLYKLI